MILKQQATAVAFGISAYFLAGGGTGPYTYAVLPDGAGGAIDDTTGLYTAPLVLTDPTVSIDTIEATDSLGATAQATILVGTALELFCDVIRNQMGLTFDQVFLWDQKWTLPKDSRVYIAVSVVTPKAFGNTLKFDPATNEMVQSVNMYNLLDLNIMSRSLEAVNRKEEVVLALASQYSQNQQTANSFYIANLPTQMPNVSEIDGAAIPYRFAISVAIQYMFRLRKPATYFDTYSGPDITTEA